MYTNGQVTLLDPTGRILGHEICKWYLDENGDIKIYGRPTITAKKKGLAYQIHCRVGLWEKIIPISQQVDKNDQLVPSVIIRVDQ